MCRVLVLLDAFWVDNCLWVFAVGGGKAPITLGIMPIKLQVKENQVTGEIYRIGATIKGETSK